MNETINIINTLLGLPISKHIFKKYLVDSKYFGFEKDIDLNGLSPTTSYKTFHEKLFKFTGIKPFNNESDRNS